jgi:hypothetical protein
VANKRARVVVDDLAGRAGKIRHNDRVATLDADRGLSNEVEVVAIQALLPDEPTKESLISDFAKKIDVVLVQEAVRLSPKNCEGGTRASSNRELVTFLVVAIRLEFDAIE